MEQQTVYVIEGLGGEFRAWGRNALKARGYNVIWFPWWWVGNIPDGAIVLGHSFGGGKLYRLLKKKKIKPFGVVFNDARLEPVGGFDISDVKVEAFNIYQKGFMRGYEIKGAENQEIRGTRHTDLPKTAATFSALRILFDRKIQLGL